MTRYTCGERPPHFRGPFTDRTAEELEGIAARAHWNRERAKTPRARARLSDIEAVCRTLAALRRGVYA